MQNKIKLPISVGDTLSLFTLNGRGPFHLKLTQFNVENNRLTWEMRTADGHTLYASNVRQVCGLPYFRATRSFICVSIPITLHVSMECLRADFIVNVPNSVSVEKNHVSAQGSNFDVAR